MSAVTAVPQPEPLSEGARIINTFVAPTKTFTDINRKASWFVPWLLLALMPIATGFTVGQKIGWQQAFENVMRTTPKRAEAFDKQLASAPPEQRAKIQRFTYGYIAASTYGWGVVRLIGYIIVSLVLMLTFNFGLGAKVEFGKALAVVTYASLPELIRSALGIVFLWAGVVQPDQYLIGNPVGSNLGALLTPGTKLWMFGVLFCDIFFFWVLSLTAIGFTKISKVKTGASFTVVFGWALLFCAVYALIAG